MRITILIFVLCIFNFIGCAQIKEVSRGIVGISTDQIEEARGKAIKKAFPYDYKTCYEKVTETLKHISAYIYTKDAKIKLIAIYVSETDTTPVGIFFREVDAANTEIEVSSPSSYAKELIAGKLFTALEKAPEIQEKEVKIDEKEIPESK